MMRLLFPILVLVFVFPATAADPNRNRYTTPIVPARFLDYSEPPVEPASEPEPVLRQPGVTNPFQYHSLEDDAMLPGKAGSLPYGTQVVGILIMADPARPPVAAIRMPSPDPRKEGVVHFVREGENIELPRGPANRRPGGKAGSQDEPSDLIFLEVHKIDSQHVEVRSKSNFEDRHILR